MQYANPIPAPERIGAIGGHEITAHTERMFTPGIGGKNLLRLSLEDAPGMGITVEPSEVLRSNIGTMVQLANRVEGIPSAIQDRERRIAEAHEIVAQADARLGTPFAHADDLAAAYDRVQTISEQLNAQGKNEQPAPAEPTPPEPPQQTSPFAAAFPRPLLSDLSRAPSATPERRTPSVIVEEQPERERWSFFSHPFLSQLPNNCHPSGS